jgi:hypothetical protein
MTSDGACLDGWFPGRPQLRVPYCRNLLDVRICRLAAGCVTLSRRAAAEKLPSSTTSSKVRRWSRLSSVT